MDLIQAGTDAIKDKDFSVKYIETGSIETDKLVTVYNKMIDTLRQERTKISEQSYFIKKLIDATPVGIIMLDYDDRISDINRAARVYLNIAIHEELEGKTLPSLKTESLNLTTLEVGDSEILTFQGRDKYKVQVNEIIHQGFKRKFIMIDDLSKELLQTEKEAYGRVIRMMAHEVNNSMGAINSILDSVIEFGFNDESNSDLKASLQVAKRRNVGLSKFMDNYASLLRLPAPIKKQVDLKKLVMRIGQLFVPRALEKQIKIEFNFPEEAVFVFADQVLIEQAVSNIIKNSIEAIANDGVIKISCAISPPSFVISDNGSGISDQISQYIFTPFFSTKTTGQGVGLMLIKDILQSHEAEFSLSTDSETGWTNFKVEFRN